MLKKPCKPPLYYRSWSKITVRDERYSRDHPGLCTFQNQVVILGGTDPESREAMKLIESYDFTTWTRWNTELNIGREGPGVIQIDDSIWVVGGRGQDVKGSVEVYENGTWNLQKHQVKHENQEYLLGILETN